MQGTPNQQTNTPIDSMSYKSKQAGPDREEYVFDKLLALKPKTSIRISKCMLVY
jgi:hypothetical protein